MTAIREVIIVFTADRTSIGSALQHAAPALKIQVMPNKEGTDIEYITLLYNGQQYGRLADVEIFHSLTLSIKSDGETLIERLSNYLNQLPTEEFNIIVQQYSLYIEDGIIIDGIIAGIASYMMFLWLNDNHITELCPFIFSTPADLHSGNSVNKHMFRTLTVPLAALARTTNNIMVQLSTFITTFINIWEPLFIEGPIIPEINDVRMALDIITQLTRQIAVDAQVRAYLNEHIQEISNRIIETAVNEITNKITAHVVHAEQHITDLIKTNIDSLVSNNIAKYSSVLSQSIDNESFSSSSINSVIDSKYSQYSQSDDITKITTGPVRNSRHITRPTNIQSTGRLSSSLPWRK